MKKARTCNKKEKALTWSTDEFLGKFSFKKGSRYELLDAESGLIFPVYSNRKDRSTLYCPNKQIPSGFKDRAKLGKPLEFKKMTIKEVK